MDISDKFTKGLSYLWQVICTLTAFLALFLPSLKTLTKSSVELPDQIILSAIAIFGFAIAFIIGQIRGIREDNAKKTS